VPEAYVHRIGRTARAGASGSAISLCDRSEIKYLRSIEKLIRQSIPSQSYDQDASADMRPAASIGTSNPDGSSKSNPGRQDRPKKQRGKAYRGKSGRSSSSRLSVQRTRTQEAKPGRSRSKRRRRGGGEQAAAV
jgi:ATP-dependent RNA helicase RhlE